MTMMWWSIHSIRRLWFWICYDYEFKRSSCVRALTPHTTRTDRASHSASLKCSHKNINTHIIQIETFLPFLQFNFELIKIPYAERSTSMRGCAADELLWLYTIKASNQNQFRLECVIKMCVMIDCAAVRPVCVAAGRDDCYLLRRYNSAVDVVVFVFGFIRCHPHTIYASDEFENAVINQREIL